MDIATAVKLIGAFLAALTIWKFFYSMKSGKQSIFRGEYEFSKKFFADVKDGDIHPYSLEKGYQAIAGTDRVKAKEVKYLLSLKDPVQCLKDYVLSMQLMENLETKGDLKLTFKSKYKSDLSRTWRKYTFDTLYFICAFLALSPFLAQNYFGFNFTKMFVLLSVSLPFFGLYAWLSLNASSKLKRGEYLVNNQMHHTQVVILKT